MKLLFVLFASLVVAACSKSSDNKMIAPAPVNFEILDAAGKSVVTSASDSVSVAYTENGVEKTHKLNIVTLQTSGTNTAPAAKYNGLVINDNAFLSNLSSQKPNPVRDFSISLNGKVIGTIYLDYIKYLDSYAQSPSAALSFNKVPVKDDRAGGYFTTGSNINLLQLQ